MFCSEEKKKIEQLMKEIERLKAENERLRGEIEQLKSSISVMKSLARGVANGVTDLTVVYTLMKLLDGWLAPRLLGIATLGNIRVAAWVHSFVRVEPMAKVNMQWRLAEGGVVLKPPTNDEEYTHMVMALAYGYNTKRKTSWIRYDQIRLPPPAEEDEVLGI